MERRESFLLHCLGGRPLAVMLLRLVYASQICPGYSHPHIEDIVRHAKAANRTRGITGVLGFDGFQIIQILEGEDDNVNPLFDRIFRDGRHYDIVILCRAPIAAVHFEDWGMARRPLLDLIVMADAIGG